MISRSTEYVLEGSKWMGNRDLRRDVMMRKTQTESRKRRKWRSETSGVGRKERLGARKGKRSSK